MPSAPPASGAPRGQLWSLQGSPWSIRARWALGLCRVPVDIREYHPVIDEPVLFFKLGCPFRGGPITVPKFFPYDKSEALLESHHIAEYAARSAAPGVEVELFPEKCLQDIEKFRGLSDTFLEYLRGITVKMMMTKPEIGAELIMPKFLQGRAFTNFLARKALTSFLAKYPPSAREDAIKAIDEIRAALQNSGYSFICGDQFTYADICVSLAVRINSMDKTYTEENAEIANKYQDIIQWANGIIDTYYVGDKENDFSLFQKI